MCRYACDLQPMLKVLAGLDNIERLLHIDVPVSNYEIFLKLFKYIDPGHIAFLLGKKNTKFKAKVSLRFEYKLERRFSFFLRISNQGQR